VIDPLANHEAQQQEPPTSAPAPPAAVSATGRRQAFQDLKRQLTEGNLAEPGTQKLILDMLINAEAERDDLKAFVAQYYEADKRAAVLQEKLGGNILNEVLATSGVGFGFALIGLTPTLWDAPRYGGPICLAIGSLLVVISVFSRARYR
jgi:hypothetical protein